MQTKPIETKFKEIYFTPEIVELNTCDNNENELFRNMDLMALQNLALIQCRR